MRKILAFVFAFTLLCSQIVYAFPATPGNASYYTATSGNADYYPDDDKLLYSDSNVSSVPLSSITVNISYYNMSGVVRSIDVPLSSSGRLSVGPQDDFASWRWISFRVPANALPSVGKYKVNARFGSALGAHYKEIYMQYNYTYKNSLIEYVNCYDGFTQSSGDWSFNYSISFPSNVKMMEFVLIPDSSFSLPYGGDFSLSFTRLPASSGVDYEDPKLSSDSDFASDTAVNTGQIADNTSQLVDGQNQIVESLKDIVQTISYQLEAFWLQLAHEFTNLYNKMNEQHAEIMQAIQDGLNVTINNQFDELIENDNKNHQEQIQNDNQNTDKIINGYDNSGLNQTNQNLSDALNEYQSKEDELLGQTTDKIENFQFDNPFTKFVAPLQDVAYMLNGIYISLGSFNIPIGFSLTLTIALLCIGWYRFRGGG